MKLRVEFIHNACSLWQRQSWWHIFFDSLLEPREMVLSVCYDTGNLLAAVKPTDGKGIDICAEIVESRRKPTGRSSSQSLWHTSRNWQASLGETNT